MNNENKTSINSVLKLSIFALYNLTYSLYMLGFIGRTINLMFLIMFVLICFFNYLKKNHFIINLKKDLFSEELKRVIYIIISFLLISICIQIYHNDIHLDYLLYNLLYLIIPIFVAFFWINTTPKNERYKYFIVILIKLLIIFAFSGLGKLNMENIMSISWNNSKSSLFESTYAHDYLLLEVVFMYFGNTALAILCTVLCMLSFKRISFILSVLLLIIYLLLKKKNRSIFSDLKVNKTLIFLIFATLCILPYLLKWIISPDGVSYFKNTFNININEFSTGRIGLINYTINNIGYFNGFGSSDFFFKSSTNNTMINLASMHCDILKLYFEVTEIGIIIYFFQLLSISKKNYISFIITIYIILEMIFSHFIDNFGIWILYFMFLAYMSSEKKTSDNEKTNVSMN